MFTRSAPRSLPDVRFSQRRMCVCLYVWVSWSSLCSTEQLPFRSTLFGVWGYRVCTVGGGWQNTDTRQTKRRQMCTDTLSTCTHRTLPLAIFNLPPSFFLFRTSFSLCLSLMFVTTVCSAGDDLINLSLIARSNDGSALWLQLLFRRLELPTVRIKAWECNFPFLFHISHCRVRRLLLWLSLRVSL